MHEATRKEVRRGAAAAAPALSEFAATPALVVVHDPSATEAFDLLARVPEDELKERTLFSARPDPERFAEEHAGLVAAVERTGVEVVALADLIGGREPWRLVERNPNQVYTRDSVITLPWLPGRYVTGAMRAPIRRPETAAMSAALEALGLRPLFGMPSDCFLEGGDVIPLGRDGRRTLLVGFGPRTSRRAIDVLCEELMPWALDDVVGVELAPWRMNLDGVLVPVADDTVVAHRGSIRSAFLRDAHGEREVDVVEPLEELGMTVLEVTREESAAMQACNCLCLGDRRIVCYDLAGRAVEALRGRGLEVIAVRGAELIKGTGGPRCMTRPIYE